MVQYVDIVGIINIIIEFHRINKTNIFLRKIIWPKYRLALCFYNAVISVILTAFIIKFFKESIGI